MKSPVGQLLSAVGTLTDLDVNWRTEVHPDDVEGRPDIGVVTDGLLNGHVELKRPCKGARPEGFTGRDRQQWERFKALPNLIYTDGSEWSLYRSGPVFVTGSEPGDLLEVTILRFEPAAWAGANELGRAE